jgi:PAS domain S-box-containing protein
MLTDISLTVLFQRTFVHTRIPLRRDEPNLACTQDASVYNALGGEIPMGERMDIYSHKRKEQPQSASAAVSAALLCTPVGRDAEILIKIAQIEQLPTNPCADLPELVRRLSDNTSLLLLSEEALIPQQTLALKKRLEEQEPWSDIPIIVFSTGGPIDSPLTARFVKTMDKLGNITIVERPTRPAIVRSALRVALNARQRQFQVRDLLAREKESIEELNAAMYSLRESEKAASLLVSIVNSSADAIISKDLSGFISSWNQGAEHLFGYTASEAVGQPITLIIPQDRLEEEPRILDRIRRGELIEHFETVRLHKSGARLDISLTMSPIRETSGKIVGASKVARDISARKQAEEALRQSEARLRNLADRLETDVQARTAELQQRNTEVLQQSDELRDLSVRLMAAQDQERRHIARELHDSAGQTLTALSMNLARLAQGVKSRAPDLDSEVNQSQELVQRLNHDIRTTSYLLHPPLLDEAGLATAIQVYCQGLGDRGGPEIAVSVPEQMRNLPAALELVIFRVIQECLTNVIRHSESKTASVKLQIDADRVAVEVQDFGKGMSPERLASLQAQGSGVGIRGMRERIRQFGGQMKISSSQSGTMVQISMPVPDGQAAGSK